MFRIIPIAFALASTPALATAHYHAQPAAKPAPEKFVLRDTMWKCGEAGCFAGESSSRPAIVCAVLVRKVGALSGFSAGGRPLSAEELEKCNTRAN